jgi:hypothetical protein
MRRVVVVISMAAALGFWGVNVLVVGPELESPTGLNAFLTNIAIAVTFITSAAAAGVAYTLVLGRGIVLGRDALAGICRRTVVVPFALSLGALVLGGSVSSLALRAYYAGSWHGVLSLSSRSLFPVGVGFALMGSLVGNLAGSVTLEVRDLGRITRVNLVLITSTTAFWLLLMWAVLHLIREQIATAVP